MLPVIAIPILHSSGAWIASTAASGYIAGTLSSSWIGAFVLGNSGVLSSIGLVSAGGILTAAGGGVASVFGAAGSLAGSALTSIGLGSVASSVGLAPATFLGLTPVGWAVTGIAIAGTATLGYFVSNSIMAKINEERVAGGLPEITFWELYDEIKKFERESMLEILIKLSKERLNFKVRRSENIVNIDGTEYSIDDLCYEVEENGGEWIAIKRTLRAAQKIFTVVQPRPA